MRRVQLEEFEVLALSRHASGHRVPPHEVPYLAMAEALSNLGVKGCLATAAVGSLMPDMPPGSMAIIEDMIDLSGRNQTRFARSIGHTDMGSAFSLSGPLKVGSQRARCEAREGAVYINVNGPRYETPAEIRMMREMGGWVVGMTAGSEAIAMREWGVPYGCLGVITNFAAGMEDAPLAHDEVTDVMATVKNVVLDILIHTIRSLN